MSSQPQVFWGNLPRGVGGLNTMIGPIVLDCKYARAKSMNEKVGGAQILIHELAHTAQQKLGIDWLLSHDAENAGAGANSAADACSQGFWDLPL